MAKCASVFTCVIVCSSIHGRQKNIFPSGQLAEFFSAVTAASFFKPFDIANCHVELRLKCPEKSAVSLTLNETLLIRTKHCLIAK